jgi:prophage antirepressor-like protein
VKAEIVPRIKKNMPHTPEETLKAWRKRKEDVHRKQARRNMAEAKAQAAKKEPSKLQAAKRKRQQRTK